MRISRGTKVIAGVQSLIVVALGSACQASDTTPSEYAVGELVDRSSTPLTVGVPGSINGTYGAGCISRSGSWSVGLVVNAALANPALSVVSGNTACSLTLTEIVADDTYAITPPIALTGSYQASPSSAATGSKAFYVNAKLSSATFTNAFTTTLLYSDTRAAATGFAASYASVSASGSASAAPAPDYTIDFTTSPALSVIVDAGNVVTSVAGAATLSGATIAGSAYVIDAGTLSASPTFAEVDAVYAAGSPTTISGATTQIAAAAFSLVGADLDTATARTVIVRAVTSSVPSYQIIRVTFSPPS